MCEGTPVIVLHQVLVVDDDEDSACLLGETLRDRGHEVRIAHDAETALALVEDFIPDVAVLDLGLPSLDGIELGRRLRARPELRGVRLIALTGFADRAVHQRLEEAGFDGHLVKPVRLAVLESMIAS